LYVRIKFIYPWNAVLIEVSLFVSCSVYCLVQTFYGMLCHCPTEVVLWGPANMIHDTLSSVCMRAPLHPLCRKGGERWVNLTMVDLCLLS